MTTKPQKSLDTQFQKELHHFVSLTTQLSEEMTMVELAEESQLSYGCIHNLLNHITVSPHFRTVYKLGRAVGLDVRFDKGNIKLNLKKRAA